MPRARQKPVAGYSARLRARIVASGGDNPEPVEEWRGFTLTAGQLLDLVGYSNGDSSEAGGAISQEPNTEHALQMFGYDANTDAVMVRFTGDVSGHLAGRAVIVDSVPHSPSNVSYDPENDWTDASYTGPVLEIDQIYEVAWASTSEID